MLVVTMEIPALLWPATATFTTDRTWADRTGINRTWTDATIRST